MHRPGEDTPGRRLPVLVGLACGLTALLLFFSATVPAIAEHDRLKALEQRQRQLLDQLLVQNRALRNTEVSLDNDPQAVLVEIDRLGLHPSELLEISAPRTAPR